MHRGRTSRRLSDVSHLFLSDPARQESGPVESTVHVAVTGRAMCRAYIGSGLACAASSGDLNVSLVETGLSLPNSGYYLGLEPEEYLSVHLGRSVSINGMRDGALSYSYSPRPSGLDGRRGSFASSGRPHLVINLFDSISLSTGGAIPLPIIKLPELFHIEGLKAGCGELLAIFTGGDEDEDVPAIIKSFLETAVEGEVIVAAYPGDLGRVRLSCEKEGLEYGTIELPGSFTSELASRRLPSGSVFRGLASRILGAMSRRERDPDAAAKG